MKIKVKKSYNLIRKHYPWFPRLGDRVGEIIETKEIGNEKVYMAKFEEPVLIGIVPENEHSFGYKPKEYRATNVVALTINDFDWL